jgi:formamidopyrimidine-DNA glycosylase
MPELPDVELFKRYLDSHALHQTIRRVTVSDTRILRGLSAEELVARLEGNRIEASERHGKHILARLARDGWLTLHFGMTGGLVYFRDAGPAPPQERLRFDFEKGRHMAYTSRRMLGRVGLTDDAAAFIKSEGLGPDALDPAFDLATFQATLGRRERDVKSVLMDQSLIAGIGNIYADEILFQARVHPSTRVAQLGEEKRRRLLRRIKEVLTTAIECGTDAELVLDRLPSGYLLPHRTRGGRCPRCGRAITSFKSRGRTSYYCSHCQRLT